MSLYDRIGGDAALEASVEGLYSRLLADTALKPFFLGVDMGKLKIHQQKFLAIAFGVIPDGLDVAGLILRQHARLFPLGLNETHFDLVAGHLIDTLKSLGVTQDMVDEVVAIVGPLRGVFKMAAIRQSASHKPAEAKISGHVEYSYLRIGEPQSLGYREQDTLFSIQAKLPAAVTTKHKLPLDEVVQFSQVTNLPASEQAQFYLNAFWNELAAGQAERIYNEWKLFALVQKEANLKEDAPSMRAAVGRLFLQRMKREMTADEFTKAFKNIDANFDKNLAFIEYLCWDTNKSPASVVYRPQVQSAALSKAIKQVLDAEEAQRFYESELELLENAATQPGVVGRRAKSQLAQKKSKSTDDIARLNGDLSRAYERVVKARKSLELNGTNFWAAQTAAENKSRLSQKAQKA